MKRVLLALVFLSFAALAGAQTMIARPFPFFYQLYSNEITDVYQDREGYVWIGTTDGVARYDGHRIVTFRNSYATPSLLAGNRVSYITDNSRYVWVGSNGGLSMFDKQHLTFRRLHDSRLQSGYLSDVVADSDDWLWAAVSGTLLHISPDGSRVKAHSPSPRRDIYINHIFIDRQHRIWVLAYGGLFLFDRRTGRSRKYPVVGRGDSPFVMYQDRDDRLWIGTWGEGLWLFRPDRTGLDCYERQVVKVSGTDKDDDIFYSIVQDDAQGYLWLLSYKELHAMMYDGHRLVPVDISGVLDPHKMFTKIAKDREGSLWLGSYDMGYNIFFNRSGISNHTLPQLKQRLGWDANLLNIAADGQVVWMSQDRYGLMLYDMATGELADRHTPVGDIALMRRSRGGGVWMVGRGKHKIVRAVRHGMAVEYPEAVDLDKAIANSGNVRGLDEDADGNLWILTDNDLFVSRRGGGIVAAGAGMPAFSAMACDASGGAWCVADGKVCRLVLREGTIQTDRVAAIGLMGRGERPTTCCLDHRGRLWIATSWGRVLRSNAAKSSFADTDLKNVIADGPVLAIVPSGRRIYVVTNKRAVQCSEDGGMVRMWRANEDNVLVKAFRQHAACPDGHGGLIVGGHGGFADIQPSGVRRSVAGAGFAPVVTDVQADGHSLMLCGDSLNVTGSITLRPDCRNVRVCFSSLLYGLGTASVVSYCLVGVDKDWVAAADGTSSAFYNYLPAGKHHFLLRCQLPDGRWSGPVDALVVVQKPVFYKSTLAYIIYVCLAVLLAALCVRFRSRLQTVAGRLRTMRKMYAGKVRLSMLDGQKSDSAGKDAEFMDKVVATIKEHVSESGFNIDRLAESLSMSRSTLYRRVSAATGVTPADIIRRVQLERACEMLESGFGNVSEIAYAVGFTSPKYFAKCFKGEFGVTPSEYQRRHKAGQGSGVG